jgi:hypothetical protein
LGRIFTLWQKKKKKKSSANITKGFFVGKKEKKVAIF